MKNLVIACMAALALLACKKDKNPEDKPTGITHITYSHYAGGDSLVMDDAYYTNAAGNQYKVSFLKYFVSGLSYYQNGKKIWQTEAPPISINAKYAEYCVAEYHKVPTGSYDSLTIAFGIVPEYNYHGSFEMSYNDFNMYWPDNLGGGYHFMKFEGHWNDGPDFGTFAFHIGANENLITLGFALPVNISEATTTRLKMTMNTHEWFENPYLYDLTQEDGYTMGDTVKMNQLVLNGQHAFTAKVLEN